MVSWKNIILLDTLQVFPLKLEKFPCTPEQKYIKQQGKQLFKCEEYLKSEFTES
jgi:hypothetical protein